MLLNLNKPKGITSQEAVTAVKRILRIKRAGHTGTLDPIATGLLIICLEESTRFAGYLIEFDKEYIITMKLGERTDTFDAQGRITDSVKDFSVSEGDIRKVLEGFKGRQIQKVPPFSAVKRGGIPLYKLARKGMDVERPLKEVIIYEIELLEISLPFVKIRTACSKGTYVRTLVDDIGMRLGTYAHISDLVRTSVGPFKIEDSFTLEEVKEGKALLLPPDTGLSGFPELRLREREAGMLKKGMFLPLPITTRFKEGTILRLYDETGFFGLGVVRAGRVKPERLLRVYSN